MEFFLRCFFRYFWLAVFVTVAPNYFMLRAPTIQRLTKGGASAADARSAFNTVTLFFAAFPLCMFVVQCFSATSHVPFLMFLPQLGGAALVSFTLFILWESAFLGALWLHPNGPLLASASCQGFVAPSEARRLLTFATLVLIPMIMFGFSLQI